MGLETDCLVNTAADQTGVLMVHGIQGSPKQFSFLAQSLPENVMTNCLLLPGHGEGVAQFKHSGQESWLSALVNAAKDMRQKCRRLVFVGHSMGCLLGLIAEKKNPGLFDHLILLC